MSSSSSNDISERVKVYCRMRPCLTDENETNDTGKHNKIKYVKYLFLSHLKYVHIRPSTSKV